MTGPIKPKKTQRTSVGGRFGESGRSARLAATKRGDPRDGRAARAQRTTDQTGEYMARDQLGRDTIDPESLKVALGSPSSGSGIPGGVGTGSTAVSTTTTRTVGLVVEADGNQLGEASVLDVEGGNGVVVEGSHNPLTKRVTVRLTALSAGDAFPLSPEPGLMHVRTDLDYELFYYDGDRSKWLSARTFEVTFTSQVAIAAGLYFRPFQGRPCTTTFGSAMPYDVTLVELRGSKDTVIAGDFDIYNETTAALLATLSIGAPRFGSSTGLDVDAAADDLITGKGGTGGIATGGNVTAVFRRRAT